MVNGTAKLVIDLGNSSTRVITKFGNTSKGTPRSRLNVLRNRFARLSLKADEIMQNQAYNEENSRVFEFNGQKYCTGDMCDNETSLYPQRPSATQPKYDPKNRSTRLAIYNAFCSGYEAISEFMNCDISSIDVDWDVTLLLPADNIQKGSKMLSDMVREITEVNFFMPEFTRDIKIKSVKVFPEGFAAFIAVLFESPDKVRSGYEYLIKKGSCTLVVDIGAGTTDFVLVKDGNIVTSSKFTVNVGGNNVHQVLRDYLKTAKGLDLDDVTAREACESGYAMNGAKEVSVVDEVNSAKEDVSNQLVNAVVQFFESQSSIKMQSINNILICGGGAEVSSNKGIRTISDYVLDLISESSPFINLVELPIIKDGDEEKHMSSRMLNIIGAGILAN